MFETADYVCHQQQIRSTGLKLNQLERFWVAARQWNLVWRVGRGREPWERSEAGGVIGNERHLHRSPVSSPTEELRKG